VSRFIFIALGAALGANARYLVGIWAGGRLGASLPYGTFLVNVTGSLLLGFMVALSTDYLLASPNARLFFATGFLGSYTTFSTFMVESLLLMREGSVLMGLANLAGSMLVGLLAALVGFMLARLIGG
jgi:CrcB protein